MANKKIISVFENRQDFFNLLKVNPGLVIIKFGATWCGPCRMMGPVIDDLSKELGQAYKFVKINIDEEREIAIKYSVSSIPTFLFMKDGNVVAKETGFINKEAFKSKITQHLG